MNVSRSLGTLGVLWLTLCLAAPAAAQTTDYDLRPAWVEGQTATYEFWTQRQRNITVSFDGQERSAATTLASEGESRWEVNRVADDGSATATLTLEWIVITLTGPDGSVLKVDSRRPGGDIPTYKQLVDAVAGVPITVQVDPDGSVASVTGLDAMRRKWGAEPFPLEDRDFIETATDTALLPAAPPALQLGGRWNTSFGWSHELGTMHHDLTWTLASIEDVEGIELATVDVAGRLRLEVDPDSLPDGAPPTDYRLTSGTFEGQVLFDLQRREAVGRNGIQEDTVEASTRLPDGRGTLKRVTKQRLQSQTLRIEEGE
ncbi:MAG: hypothetical protein AAGB29_12905 [Planctomycetota bacterium]